MSNSDIALRERILAEGARLFMEHGYNGISMREIAEAVGVSKAGLYYHFKDKQDLFLAIMHGALDATGQIVRQAAGAGPDVGAQLGALVRGLAGQPADQRALVRLAGNEIAHLGPEARAGFGQRYQAQFIGPITAMLASGMARGELRPSDPPTLTWLLLGMLYPFLTTTPAGGARTPDTAIDALLELFLHGAAADRR